MSGWSSNSQAHTWFECIQMHIGMLRIQEESSLHQTDSSTAHNILPFMIPIRSTVLYCSYLFYNAAGDTTGVVGHNVDNAYVSVSRLQLI